MELSQGHSSSAELMQIHDAQPGFTACCTLHGSLAVVALHFSQDIAHTMRIPAASEDTSSNDQVYIYIAANTRTLKR